MRSIAWSFLLLILSSKLAMPLSVSLSGPASQQAGSGKQTYKTTSKAQNGGKCLRGVVNKCYGITKEG